MTHQSLYPPTTKQTTQSISGMRAKIVLLRCNGQKLSREEFSASIPIDGELFLGPVHAGRTGGGATTFAELLTQGPFVRPLWNPSISHIDARGIVLSGYELHHGGHGETRHRQAWLVVPL